MVYFNFVRVDSFLDDINREDCFDTLEMDGEQLNFKIVLASECPTDINQCIDVDGTLITPYDASKNQGVTLIDTLGERDGLVSLLWSKGINGERTMSITNTVTSFDFGDVEIPIKAAFLVSFSNGSGYVIAYSIRDKVISTKGVVPFPIVNSVWSVKYGR